MNTINNPTHFLKSMGMLSTISLLQECTQSSAAEMDGCQMVSAPGAENTKSLKRDPMAINSYIENSASLIK